MYACMHVCMYVYIHNIYICVCVRVTIYVYMIMYVCIYIYIYHVYIFTTCIDIYIYIQHNYFYISVPSTHYFGVFTADHSVVPVNYCLRPRFPADWGHDFPIKNRPALLEDVPTGHVWKHHRCHYTTFFSPPVAQWALKKWRFLWSLFSPQFINPT